MSDTHADIKRIVTIGVYGFTETGFVAALTRSRVDLLIDVRRRRGVRGRGYVFANSTRLQCLLRDAGIAYEHALFLAPTDSTRLAQSDADRAASVTKRSRVSLSAQFVERYRGQLGSLDLADRLDVMLRGVRVAALLCVERDPQACHRGLIADELCRQFGVEVEHLTP